MILFATAVPLANAVTNQVEPFIHHRKLLREAQLRGADAQGCTFESCTGQPSTCPHQAAVGFGSSRPSQGLQPTGAMQTSLAANTAHVGQEPL